MRKIDTSSTTLDQSTPKMNCSVKVSTVVRGLRFLALASVIFSYLRALAPFFSVFACPYPCLSCHCRVKCPLLYELGMQLPCHFVLLCSLCHPSRSGEEGRKEKRERNEGKKKRVTDKVGGWNARGEIEDKGTTHHTRPKQTKPTQGVNNSGTDFCILDMERKRW